MQERHASQPRPRGRRYSGDKKHRRFGKRVDWQELKDSLTEFEFKRAYRMTKQLFDILLSKIRDKIRTHDELRAGQSSVGVISPELRLSMTLRFFQGGRQPVGHPHGPQGERRGVLRISLASGRRDQQPRGVTGVTQIGITIVQ